MRVTALKVAMLIAVGYALLVGANTSPAPLAQAQWMSEDIAVFRTEFLAVDRSFTPASRAAAEVELSRLERESETISPDDFAAHLCRIAALADNAHTQCPPTFVGHEMCRGAAAMLSQPPPGCRAQTADFEIPEFATVPLAFFPFGGDFNVTGTDSDEAEVLGCRLVAIEGRPLASILPALRGFAGGTDARRDLAVASALASPVQLHAVGLSRHTDAATYTFLTLQGQTITKKFNVPGPADKRSAWQQLPESARAPWAFQTPEIPFRWRDAPEADAIVIQLRQIFDTNNQRIGDFLETAESHRASLTRKHVVLDMRFNGGGNLMLIRDFMRRWPKRAPGQFYVLTGRETFSAAIASIAYLKQAGGPRVTIVGEPVGDRLTFFSDGLPVRLPHSGRYFLPAVLRMDYRDGCRSYSDCFEGVAQPGRPTGLSLLSSLGRVDRMPISVTTLDPDLSIPSTIESWVAGRDAAMEAALSLAAKPMKESGVP
jgi:hypothetical protein